MSIEASGFKVRAQETPNPETLRFTLPLVVAEEPLECKTSLEAEDSPLAKKLFGFPWTSSVYIGRDFVTLTKQDWVEWSVLTQPLIGLIQNHLESGEAFITKRSVASSSEADSPLVQKIKLFLDQEVRPVVALDGGDIVFSRLDGDQLFVELRGSCSGCPSSMATLKDGVEVRIKQVFPEIREVVAE